jgi:hypothetical protein
MDSNSKTKDTKNNRKTDSKFDKKQIKHDPQAESARIKFGKDK